MKTEVHRRCWSWGLCFLPILLLVTQTAFAEPLRLMAFGDSLVHGYGLKVGDTFPEQLESALQARGQAVKVLNAGNSGDTTAAGLARLDWTLADQPDAVIVVLGGNDGLRGLEPREMRANLEQILERLKERGVPILLAGMRAPRNLGAAYAAEFDAVFPQLAQAHGVIFYPFFLEGVAAVPGFNQADGIHPNAAGVGEIVERILPSVLKLLSSSQAAARG